MTTLARTETSAGARRAALIAGPAVYVAAIMAYLWFGYPTSRWPLWVHAAAWTFFVGLPLLSNLMTGLRFDAEGFRTTGVRLDNLKEALIAVLPIALGLAVLIAAIGITLGALRTPQLSVLMDKGATYAAFGPAQQFLINAYAVRQFRLARLEPTAAIASASGLFALAHAPNLPVMAATFVIGVLFARSFQRVPNIITLGIAHGMLASCVYWMLPVSWHHDLAVGVRFYPG